MSSPKNLPQKLVPWVEARRRHRLSHAHVQMARELGLNPKKLGKLDNHDQETWKAPLPDFIARVYFKRFGRERPSGIFSLEEIAARQRSKKEVRRAHRLATKPPRDADADPAADASVRPGSAEEPRPTASDEPKGPPWF